MNDAGKAMVRGYSHFNNVCWLSGCCFRIDTAQEDDLS